MTKPRGNTTGKTTKPEAARAPLTSEAEADLAAGRGRPTLLTPELQERICRSIRVGNYIDVAAEANGINRQTLFNWFRRGRSKDPADKPFADFLAALQQAEAEAEARDVELLDALVHGSEEVKDDEGKVIRPKLAVHPGMLTWRLERRHPRRWGRADRLDMTVGGEVDLNVKVGEMTREERQARTEALLAKRAAERDADGAD